MSYQFGTNWSVFSDLAGPVIGPLMAYEVMSRLFPGSRLLGNYAVWHESRWQGLALRGNRHGCVWNGVICHLDFGREQLDAHTRGL